MTKHADQKTLPSRTLRRPARLGDEVYNAIYTQLMSLSIAPGSRISIDNLVRELGVSQTPIREALSRLEAQGLVVKTHLIGYSAAGHMDDDQLEQLYEVRLLLEPFAAERAATNASDEAIAQIETLHATMGSISATDSRRTDYGEFARLDGQFHDLIAAESRNELVQETLARLHAHVHLFRLYHHAKATTDANAEHERIVSAIRQRNGKIASDSMRVHIEQSRKRFLLDRR